MQTRKDMDDYKRLALSDFANKPLKTADSLLKKYAHQQEIVAALGQKALLNLEIDALMNEALVLLTDALQVQFGGVWECTPEKPRLILRASFGWHKSFKPDILNRHQESRGITCNIEGEGTPYGVIGVYSQAKRQFSKEEVRFLQSVANVLAIAIGRKRTEDRIKTNEQRLQLAQSAAKIGTFEWNIRTDESVITPEFESLYGCHPGEMKANPKRWFEVIHPEDKERVKARTEVMVKEETDLNVEYRVIWPDKSIHWLLVKGQLVHDNKPKPSRMLGVAIDICDRKQTEEGIEFLSEASKALSSSLDYQTTLSAVAKLAVPKIADWCAVDMINETGEPELVTVAHIDPEKVKWARELRRLNPVDLSQETGLSKVLKTGQSIFYPKLSKKELQAAAKSKEEWQTIQKIGLSALIIVPLKVGNKVVGGITLVSSQSHHPFSEADLNIAEQLADRAAAAIENARLYRAAQMEIAERKKMEDELLQSHNQLEIIIQNVADAIVVQDNQGKLIYTNDKGLKLLGCKSAGELKGLSWEEVLDCFEIYDEHKKPLPRSRLPGRQLARGKRSPQLTLFVRHRKNKHEHWLNVKSRPVYDAFGKTMMIVNILGDITDEKHSAQEQLKLASIVESSDDAIFSKDLSGIVTSWNRGASKMYGYSAKDMIGQPITKTMSDGQLDEFAEIMEIIKMGESVDHLETTRTRKDGKVFDVSVSVTPLKDQTSQVIGASVIARDISSTKELERRKDAFIGMASHELKTPITSMKAFTQVIGRRMESSPDMQLRMFLSKLDNQIDRLADLVNDLLDLSKIEAGKLELNKQKFNIGQLIKETIEDIQSVTPTHLISAEGVSDQEILGDKDRINQVLVNLLTNAVKYSPGKNKILVKTMPNKSKVTLCVQDFGIGIDKEDQERIFDRFFREQGTSEKTFPGLGIGLYISAELVRRHGGHIWVKSQKGKGSEFYVSFPIG